ncbi:glucooligosaccharide oxidase protein [Rutstroemia sp. NJR-2017a BBW]|nr:glucooligosaccharide oxidase protein [Rutstroemia sp. NJR-2017a BBW]
MHQPNRHKHLQNGLRSTISRLAILCAVPLSSAFPYSVETRATSIQDCLTQHSVPFQDSSSSTWSTLIQPYNLRLPYTPAIVTLPTTSQHVSDSVTCAAAAGLKVQAKSGGHSYASFSTGGKDGSLIVNLQNFNSISVNAQTNIATVGGGVRLGNLALGLYNQGKRAVPHGTCPGVGIGGHFLHGGYGYASRLWGLALDTIVGLDVVLANGTQVHTTSTAYPELFYAMRGAGDSFGIATTFYLQTFAAPSNVVTFSASIPSTLSSVSTAVSSFTKLQAFTLDQAAIYNNITLGIYTDNYGSFSLSGWCVSCNIDTFKSTTFQKILAAFPAAQSTSVKSLGWTDALVDVNNGGALAEPLTGYNAHDTFYAKSVVTKNAQPLTNAQLTSFFSFLINKGRNAPGDWYSIIDLYGGAGSQVNVPSADASAYSDRDAHWVIQNYAFTSSPPFPSTLLTYLDSLNSALTSTSTTFSTYLNYVDPSLSAVSAAVSGYGSTTYNKLLSLKQTYDAAQYEHKHHYDKHSGPANCHAESFH